MAIFTSFNIGKDLTIQLVIKNALGIVVPDTATGLIDSNDLGLLMNFNCDPINGDVEIKPINNGGEPLRRNTFGGWRGTLDFARANSNLDKLGQILQDSYYGTGTGAVLIDVLQTIASPLGLGSGYLTLKYPNATLKQTKGGDFKSEDSVMQGLEFMCSRRELIEDTAGSTSVQAASLSTLATILKGIGGSVPVKA